VDIPFVRPGRAERDKDYALAALGSGFVVGDGPFGKRCERLLADELRVPRVLLTTSCTHALEMAALLLDVKAGDEVVAPSFTFVSTVNAFVLRGARPVFVDIRPDTLNIDESRLEDVITKQSKAVVAVHYAGVGCEMEAVTDIATRKRLALIEDNAHGLFGKYRGKFLGTFGCLATQSFHGTKNFTCGEGGALIVNDETLVNRAEVVREKGTNRSRFFRGEIDKYTWVDLGSSYVMSEILAAVLLAQLEARASVQERRKTIWNNYNDALASWAKQHEVQLPHIPPGCDQSYHMFYLVMPTANWQQRMLRHLKNQGIGAAFHYLPLHLSDYGRKFGGKEGDFPVTEYVSSRLIRLPFFNDLTRLEQDRVIDAVCSFSFK
jgi:dTDP-4-amino-4,6-dideoxygalactose transaminase